MSANILKVYSLVKRLSHQESSRNIKKVFLNSTQQNSQPTICH